MHGAAPNGHVGDAHSADARRGDTHRGDARRGDTHRDVPSVVADLEQQPTSRIPAVFRSVRFRLTMLYSVMLFGVASMVLGGIYWGLTRSLDQQISSELSRQSSIAFDVDQDRYEERREFELLVDQRTLQTLRQNSMVGLGALFVLSFGVGWFTAGRVLTPIGRITRVARDIQATDLSRRIGLLGPDDDLKQLADTFDAMLDRLEHAFKNQQRLIHDTSHELRNPLAVMRTNLDVTLSDPAADLDQYRQTTEVVRRSSERMSKLVEDLLAYARHEAATRVEGPVNLSQLTIELAEEFEGAVQHAGLRLELDVAPKLSVVGHDRSLEQALANLLANAVRFAPVDTAITLTAAQHADWVWVSVSDEGPGITEADRDRVFKRYVRLSEGEEGRPHLAGGKGSGIGLAIVRDIVESHRGNVSIVDSASGATFAMWLPAHHDLTSTGEFRLRRPRRRSSVS